MNNTLWFYSDTQQTYGPIAAPQLIAMIQAGQLVAGHFIMPQGAQEWQYVSASPFAGYLPQAVPPAPVAPPPPQSPQRVPGQPFRPPQQRAAAPAPTPQAVKKSRSGLIATVAVLLLAAVAGAYFRLKPATAAGGSSATASSFPTATKEQPFINSLGMKFVPVPGTDVLMCIHETRKQDFAAYAATDPLIHDVWRKPTWEGKSLSTGDDHPAVCINWYDAAAFCEWLSAKEGRAYRLPTDHEWCLAAGITTDPEAEVPYDPQQYPVPQFTDPNCWTSPVMSFNANNSGFFDLRSFVGEWCVDAAESKAFNLRFDIHAKLIPYSVMRGTYSRVLPRSAYSIRPDGAFAQSLVRRLLNPYQAGFRCMLAKGPLPAPAWIPIKRANGCVTYNPAMLKIMDRGADGWLLTDGNVHLQLLDNEDDANFALAMAKEHTQRCLIGNESEAFEYWTGDSGIKGGVKAKPTRIVIPDKLRIKDSYYGENDIGIPRYKKTIYQSDDPGPEYYYEAAAQSSVLFDSEPRAQTALEMMRQRPHLYVLGWNNKRSSFRGQPERHPAYLMRYWE